MSREPKDLAEQLRAVIEKRGLTGYRIAKDTDIAQTAIAAFMRGGNLRLDTASKLAAYLGLELKEK